MARKKESAVKAELRQVQQANGGLLDPEKVVLFAMNPKTALHARFTWDDKKASHEYRLWEARAIIRVHVVILPEAPKESVRAWVSLDGDRKKGGYRSIEAVMESRNLRDQLLEQAMRDMDYFRQKYRVLNELADVFSAFDRVRKRRKKK